MVRVHFFAGLRELAKTSHLELGWEPDSTVASIRRSIVAKVPAVSQLLERSSVAVNDLIVSSDFAVPDGAEVAFLPPVSGGC